MSEGTKHCGEKYYMEGITISLPVHSCKLFASRSKEFALEESEY